VCITEEVRFAVKEESWAAVVTATTRHFGELDVRPGAGASVCGTAG
jgi:hypothetical protein